MKLAIIGCGYVADFYLRTLALHPELVLVAVHDRDHARAERVADRHGVRCHASLDALLADREVELVVNLTNPASHAAITRACLEAGRHVYSEKPLAMSLDEARALTALAAQRGLVLASAPCNVLGEAAQTVLQQIRAGTVGRVRAVHAEMDDGPIRGKDYWLWRNTLGVPWPYRDEFEVGCVIEHAAYYLTWLIACWGPAISITAAGERDYTVGVLRFASGVTARLTCSIVAPENRGLLVIGEDGLLSVGDCWQYGAEVKLRGTMTMARFRRWLVDHREQLGVADADLALALTVLEPPGAGAEDAVPTSDLAAKRALRRITDRALATAEAALTAEHTLPLVRAPRPTGMLHDMDFTRGVAECADAARHGRASRLAGDFALHVLECTLALRSGGTTALTTTCGAFEPMPWAISAPARA